MKPRTAKPGKTLQHERTSLERLCRRYGVRPDKERSQHFLIDASVLAAIMAEARLTPEDWVLEVGGGFGALTAALLRAGPSVTTVEIDERLGAALLDRFRSEPRFTLVVGDFFRYFRNSEPDRRHRPYCIVANLPYQSTSFFFDTVLTSPAQPTKLVVLVQREVAERIVAKPGEMSLLSLSVQLYGQPRIIQHVPAHSFWPVPEVESALLVVAGIRPGPPETPLIFRLARFAFAGRRKQIHNTLAAGLQWPAAAVRDLLQRAALEPSIRPQELSVEDWRRLARAKEAADPERKSTKDPR